MVEFTQYALKGRVFKIRLKSDAFFTYGIDAFHCQIWRKVYISPFFNVPMSWLTR